MKRFIPLALLGCVLLRLTATAAVESAPDFALPRIGTNGVAKLSDYSGKVVVLDFFAYWCAPCGEASSSIHRDVAAHYALKQGNPAGVPVEVLVVNVEADNPKETAAFIKKHRLENVVTDRDGKVFESLRGGDLPFIVIIDGTKGDADKPRFEVVYRRSGFEGAAKLRAVIDAIPAPTKPKPEDGK